MTGMDAFGTTFARGDGTTPTEVFTTLAGVSNIGGPGMSRETIDVTAHDSPDGYREFIGGLRDAGEISIDLNYRPEVHDSLVEDLDAENPINYKLTFPDGTEWAFPAILTEFEPEAPIDDKLAASATYKVSGKPVITPAV